MMSIVHLLLVVGLYLGATVAQTLPFLVTGFLDSAVADSGSDVNRGGTITISGYTVKVPKNLLVEFPAAFIPWAEFAEGGPSARAGPPNEVSITGNVVNGQIIAGQVAVSQLDLAGSSGIIERLDIDGGIKILNGPVIRINDPRAIYSAGYDKLPFFTADDENPSITSFSGVPMCVPRVAPPENDPKCPASNRPAGTTFPLLDASHMVPLKVGDYVEYSGVQKDGETIVYGMVVNVGITTSGNQPAFIRVEDALIGIADAGVDVEAARYRFVGYASRADFPVTIWAIDEDPCTGEESDRLLGSGAIDAAEVRNKWEIRLPKLANIGKYTRNYRVRIGDEFTTQDDIRAGQYIQPVTEWIFPELVTPGGTPPPNDFTNIGPLRDGFGPINGKIFGQLEPWPGAAAPTPVKDISTCPDPNTPPPDDGDDDGGDDDLPNTEPVNVLASAGADKTVLSGVFVTLTATQTNTTIAGDFTFNWTQISGPTPFLTLTGANTATVSFVPPAILTVGTQVQREFQVVITHTLSGSQANDTVVVTASRTPPIFDNKGFDTLTWASKQSGTAAATAHTDLVDPAGSMRIKFGTGAEQPMVRGTLSGGKVLYSYSARSTARFTSATIYSYINNVKVETTGVTSTNVGAG